MVLDDANNAQVCPLFTDDDLTTPDQLYTSVRNTAMDPSGRTWTTYQPVPYPLSGAAGTIVVAPTLPHAVPVLPDLSTVVYAQIASGFEADQRDEVEVSQAP